MPNFSSAACGPTLEVSLSGEFCKRNAAFWAIMGAADCSRHRQAFVKQTYAVNARHEHESKEKSTSVPIEKRYMTCTEDARNAIL